MSSKFVDRLKRTCVFLAKAYERRRASDNAEAQAAVVEGFDGRAAHLMHCFQPTLCSGISPLGSAPACAAASVHIYKSAAIVFFLASPELNIG
jgi:hypothetical protein